jgi:hypothetical protein
MKQCPLCGRTFTEDNQFCLEDGTVLMSAEAAPTEVYSGDFPTVAVPDSQETPTVVVQKIPPTQHFENSPQFQPLPQQFQVPPTPQTQQTKTAKWVYPVLGLLLAAVGVLGLAVIYQFTKKDERVLNNANQTNKETPKPTEKSTQKPTVSTSATAQISDAVPGKYPEGSTRYLNESDIAGKSVWDLRIMRNEIFARRGRRFKNADLRNYFMSQSWYNPRFDEVQLTEIETRNVEFLRSYE